jgi:hypothetical protein
VYLIRAIKKSGARIPLQRLNGVDSEGILYIGKSKNMRTRIRAFVSDIRKGDLDPWYHSAGWNFREYFLRNRSWGIIKLTEENLEASWKMTARVSAASRLENQLLQAYVMRFQDKPPLNISINRE